MKIESFLKGQWSLYPYIVGHSGCVDVPLAPISDHRLSVKTERALFFIKRYYFFVNSSQYFI